MSTFPSPAGEVNISSVKAKKNICSSSSSRISSVISSPSISLRNSSVRVYSVLSTNSISPCTTRSKGPCPSGSLAVATIASPPSTGVQVKITSVIISSSFSQGGASGALATLTVQVTSNCAVPSLMVELAALSLIRSLSRMRKLPMAPSTSTHSEVKLDTKPMGRLFASVSA